MLTIEGAAAFTGGVGENSALIRSTALNGMKFLGLEIDPRWSGQQMPVDGRRPSTQGRFRWSSCGTTRRLWSPGSRPVWQRGGTRPRCPRLVDRSGCLLVFFASMLRLDLVALERRRTIDLDAVIPVDAELWSGTEFRLIEPVSVTFRATSGHAGQILLRGTIKTRLEGECRRCLCGLGVPLSLEPTLVFMPREGESVEDEEQEEDDGLRLYDDHALEIDLGEVVREELVLGVPAWPLCRPDCRGLCPRCGVDLNETSCTCTREESDSRWAALRALKNED